MTGRQAVVYNCATCNEPKYRDQRWHHWAHLRGDSVCDDASDPVAVTLPARTR